jgi:hypothetical protein
MDKMYRLAFLAVVAAACNDPTYLVPPRALETRKMMGGGWGPDSARYTIPIRKPSDAEKQALVDEQMQLGLHHEVPWVGVRDLPVEIAAVVDNLDDASAQAFFTYVGGSEFGNYDPMRFVDPNNPESVPPPPLGGLTPLDLPPHGQAEVLFREDQVATAAHAVEAIVRYPSMPATSTPFKVLLAGAESTGVGFENVPPNDVMPQLLTFRLSLTADAHVRATYEVRARDLSGRLAPPDAMDLYR